MHSCVLDMDLAIGIAFDDVLSIESTFLAKNLCIPSAIL